MFTCINNDNSILIEIVDAIQLSSQKCLLMNFFLSAQIECVSVCALYMDVICNNMPSITDLRQTQRERDQTAEIELHLKHSGQISRKTSIVYCMMR